MNKKLSMAERAANEYADESTGVDEFTPGQKLLMRAAFLAGVAWQKGEVLWLIEGQEGVSHWTAEDTVELLKSKCT